MEVDLIDDIWQQVFNYFGVHRARLATVSKRWSSLILNPRNWRSFEADFSGRRKAFGAVTSKADLAAPFITKYCTELIECHLILDHTTYNGTCLWVNTLLQIKTLRRLYVQFISGGFGRSVIEVDGNQLVVPQCKDLVLLNLMNFAITNPEDLQRLLISLPNVEELYLSQGFTSAEVFAPAQKLKLLSVNNDVYTSQSELQKLPDVVPSLQYLLYHPNKLFGETSNDVSTVGNIMLIPDTVFRFQAHVAIWKQLGTFVSPSVQPLLLIKALQNRCSKEVVQYLVNERKYDVNYTHNGNQVYTENTRDNQMASCPVIAAVSTEGKFTFSGSRQPPEPNYVLEELLKLGANPNSPLSNDSPLHHCQDATTFMMLIKYGANPNKLVDGLPAGWSLFDRDFVEPELALEGILNMIDVNAIYGEESILLYAINSREKSVSLVKMLIKAGAQWTPNSLNALFDQMPKLVEEVVSRNTVDFSMLETSVVFKSLERGMLNVLRDHLKTLTTDEEEPKLSPMHYAALLCTGGSIWTNQFGNPLSRKEVSGRWLLNTKRDTFQKASDNKANRRIGSQVTSTTTSTPKSDVGTTNVTDHKVGSLFGSNAASTTTLFASTTSSNFGQKTAPSTGFGSNNTGQPNFFANFGSKLSLSGAEKDKPSSSKVHAKLESIDEIIPLLNCSINETSNDGTTPLLMMCKWARNNEEKVKNAASLINHGANVNLADKHGWTPLHAALYVGDWKLASLLLEHGANINAQDEKGITPLMALIYGFRHIQVQKQNSNHFDHFESEWSKLMTLCDVDLTLVDRSFNRSLVHLMASIGCPSMFECAEQKILKPDFINARDIEGFTPLHYAVMFDNIEMVRYLLDHGADANAQTVSLKITPAMMLCNMIATTSMNHYLNHYNTLLLGQFAFTQLPTEELLVEPPWLYALPEQNIECEKINNFDEMMQLLLSNSDPALIDDDGNTVLHHILNLISFGPISLVRSAVSIAQSNQSFKTCWATKNYRNETPAYLLMYGICMFAFIDATWLEMYVKSLIAEQEIDLNREDTHALALLFKGSLPPSFKHSLMAQLDLSRAKYVPQPSKEWQGSPLFDLFQGRCYNADLVKAVLDAYPSSINKTNCDGATPLIYYVIQLLQDWNLERTSANPMEIMAVIDVLLAAPGVAVNAQDQHGNTALHYACKHFHTGIIDAIDANFVNAECEAAAVHCLLAFKLVEAGARTDVENKRGQTPLDLTPKLMQHYQEVYPIVKSKVLEAKPAKNAHLNADQLIKGFVSRALTATQKSK